ncbi:MAG: hypothetical protein NTX19_03310 [Gemmatimonadetes bacterium]|nr:hypothetical protein [Gemmatimonadota bacterium]
MPAVPDDARPALDILKSVGGGDMIAMLMRTFVRFAATSAGVAAIQREYPIARAWMDALATPTAS